MYYLLVPGVTVKRRFGKAGCLSSPISKEQEGNTVKRKNKVSINIHVGNWHTVIIVIDASRREGEKERRVLTVLAAKVPFLTYLLSLIMQPLHWIPLSQNTTRGLTTIQHNSSNNKNKKKNNYIWKKCNYYLLNDRIAQILQSLDELTHDALSLRFYPSESKWLPFLQ